MYLKRLESTLQAPRRRSEGAGAALWKQTHICAVQLVLE